MREVMSKESCVGGRREADSRRLVVFQQEEELAHPATTHTNTVSEKAVQRLEDGLKPPSSLDQVSPPRQRDRWE